MNRSLGRVTLCVVVSALSVGSAYALAAAPAPTGPVYPLPDTEPATAVGDSGRAGGVTFTYTDLQTERYDPAMWGVWSGSLPQLAMDGAVDAPGETMGFSAPASDLAAGKAVYSGSANLPGVGTFATRTVVRSLTAAGGPLAMSPAADLGLPADIGAAAIISGDFKSNIVLEVNGGSDWIAAKDFFDAAQTTPGQGGQLVTSTSGGFYYVPANVLPQASFGWSPQTQTAGRAVEFTSTSVDPDGEIVATAWDLDGDGEYDDANGATTSKVFAAAGDNTVGIEVTDDRDGVDTATEVVTIVPNEPPSVSVSWSPEQPRALQAVTFTASADDSDGEVVEIAWDLDGDGEFDDGTGESASVTFDEGGEYTVGARAVDDLGGVDTEVETVTVSSCEKTAVSQSLRSLGKSLGIEPTVRQLNCTTLAPLGL